MQTLAYMAIGLGFYLHWYRSSKTNRSENAFLTSFVEERAKSIPYISIALLLIALISLVFQKGIAAGSLDFLLVLMALGSLIILLAPLRLSSPVFLLILLTGLLGLEFII